MAFVAGLGLGLACGDDTPSGAQQCRAGEQLCGGRCYDVAEDPSRCGDCANACAPTTPFCARGTCVASCPADLTVCRNRCVNLATSSNNCGSCGKDCDVGQE